MSSISSVSSNSASMMQGMMRPPRPSAEQTEAMASDLFGKLDASSQGYLTKADLQSAMIGDSSASSSASSMNVDSLFSALDGDGDGKVTKQEFTDVLKQAVEQLDSQAMQAGGSLQGSEMGRGMSGMMMGGMMPPPPPPSGDGSAEGNVDEAGFSKDELTSQLSSVESSDTRLSSLLSDIIGNFDAADTNGDGKVSAQEAMAFEQSKSSSAEASSASASSASGSDLDDKVLSQIIKLLHAYSQAGNPDAPDATQSSTFSVTA